MQNELSQIDRTLVNNDYYHQLGKKWYTAQDDPVALLRAESKTRNPWIHEVMKEYFPLGAKALDVGCGGGFLSNFLASEGWVVTGLDLSKESLEIAKAYDSTNSAKYIHGDAYKLPFPGKSFEVVTCMDFLEHVSEPKTVLKEIQRVLKGRGLFFFHTFNRNYLSWLVVIKGVEWFVKNTPDHLHVLPMFIKPKELKADLDDLGLQIEDMRGLRPKLDSSFVKLIKSGIVDDNFSFQWTKSTLISYTGFARKLPNV
jgi:2-polyprenyl-6-hydroxyphenyl methylase / 3-demethylubiquinone-9 3-methyltransferase